jgi:hypothetical protein
MLSIAHCFGGMLSAQIKQQSSMSGVGYFRASALEMEKEKVGLSSVRGSTRKNVIFSNSLWTNSEYPISLKYMSI